MKESFLIDMGLRIAERRKVMQLTQEKLAEKWVLVCKAFQLSN